MDQSRLDRRAHDLGAHRTVTRFEPPKLASVGGRISRSAAEVGALGAARDEGRAQAMAELAGAIEQNRRAAADMTAAAEALSSALQQLRRADTTQVEGVEQNVLALAVALAEEIIGRQIRDDDQLVMTAAARALALAPDREPVLLRVNPADVAVVRASMPADEASVHPVHVVADASIERAGVVAEVGPLRIDAQVGPALARIRDAFSQ